MDDGCATKVDDQWFDREFAISSTGWIDLDAHFRPGEQTQEEKVAQQKGLMPSNADESCGCRKLSFGPNK